MKIYYKKMKLKSLILDTVYNILKNTYLFEYLVHRKKFINDTYNLIPQILENWCLIRYCTLTNRNETKEHWKNELCTHLEHIMFENVKSNNSYESRFKAIKEAFKMADLNDNENRIFQIVRRKLINKEHIPLDNIFNQVILDCFNSLNDIASVLSNVNRYDLIEKYVNNI